MSKIVVKEETCEIIHFVEFLHCCVFVAKKYLFTLSLYGTCIFMLQGAIMEDALQIQEELAEGVSGRIA